MMMDDKCSSMNKPNPYHGGVTAERHANHSKTELTLKPHRCGRLTVDRLSSPGVRQLSVGEVRVRVRGERGVLGVRGEGSVSQALYPLGGGVGMATPERWQQASASDIQASRSFSLSQSKRGCIPILGEKVYIFF